MSLDCTHSTGVADAKLTHAQVIWMSELAARAWRNGLGTMRRIATAGAPDDPDWTLSIATIAAPCEFSMFAGLDRVAMVVGDDPIMLTINGSASHLTHLDRIRFAGEDLVRAQPTRGQTQLLNLMVRRTSVHGEIYVRRISGTSVLHPGDAEVWVVLSGSVTTDFGVLSRWDTLRLNSLPHNVSGAASLAGIRISPALEENQ
ncbi:HutD/Ves family protein [Gordonia rhizosphera]|uniref:HutD family protein n=1 Tax=Gordonia rhizosphera NBRC 16068 TaxID=1108045 RepID=K6V4S9_9ACTN|nr:HutD family protein [Gordonia rhizosphera]GAB91183.1 hypothetical protein GORHZ_125_00660 [Gordonia rhizosphera NBRC 16068]